MKNGAYSEKSIKTVDMTPKMRKDIPVKNLSQAANKTNSYLVSPSYEKNMAADDEGDMPNGTQSSGMNS
jgi:hypothetical protein